MGKQETYLSDRYLKIKHHVGFVSEGKKAVEAAERILKADRRWKKIRPLRIGLALVAGVAIGLGAGASDGGKYVDGSCPSSTIPTPAYRSQKPISPDFTRTWRRDEKSF